MAAKIAIVHTLSQFFLSLSFFIAILANPHKKHKPNKASATIERISCVFIYIK